MLAGALLVITLLQAAPAQGTLRVKSDVSEVEVFLDGKSVGKTPLTVNAVAGAHRITFTKPGYADREEQATVEAGATAKLFVVMKPLPAEPPKLPVQFTVIHQHRAGACSGILTVTAEAVDFRSLDGKDVFHIPISEMHSVSRSMGSLPNVSWNLPHEYLGCRIEGPGRSYGFFAYEEDPKLAGTPAENRVKFQDTAVKTKELFELVYRLWSETLKPKKK
jgi:hypothetical protein